MNTPRGFLRSVLVLAALGLCLSAAGPGPDGWKWVTTTPNPTLTLLLGGPVVKKTLALPPAAALLNLELKKYLMEEDGVKLEWKVDGQPWLTKNKKIPGSRSTELVVLPPGTPVTLTVSTRSGKLLADITLQRK